MADIKQEIAAYEAIAAELAEKHFGKWVIFHGGELVDVKGSFDEAAQIAVDRFGRGPYLIRQVGANSVTLPASVMFRPIYA